MIQVIPLAKFGIALLKMKEYVVVLCLCCGHVKAIYRQNWETNVPPMVECKCEVKTA